MIWYVGSETIPDNDNVILRLILIEAIDEWLGSWDREFVYHDKIAEAFDRFLAYLDKNFYTDDNLTPTVAQSRERSILVTKLEEAAFFAKKALASRKENQA